MSAGCGSARPQGCGAETWRPWRKGLCCQSESPCQLLRLQLLPWQMQRSERGARAGQSNRPAALASHGAQGLCTALPSHRGAWQASLLLLLP